MVLAGQPATAAANADRPTPSGLPVPRWVTTKFATVNARGGPGDEHRKLWVYRVKGLPVQVVAETRDWRRVCDAQGGLAWVHKRTVDGTRGVLNLNAGPEPLLAKPQPGAAAQAYLAPGALAKLDRCKAGWCRVEAGGTKGWAPAAALWGADDRANRCRAAVRR